MDDVRSMGVLKSKQVLGVEVNRKAYRGKHKFFHTHASSDRAFSEDEAEYISAMRSYMDYSGHRFPTISEYLMVARTIGYAKPQGSSPFEGWVALGDRMIALWKKRRNGKGSSATPDDVEDDGRYAVAVDRDDLE